MTNKIEEYEFREEIEKIGFEIVTLNYFFNEFSRLNRKTSHKINFYAILFITKGEGIHSIDFNEYAYKKGNVLFVEKKQIHAWTKSKDVEGFLILFTSEFLFRNQVIFNDISYSYPFNNSLYKPFIYLKEDNYHSFNALINYLFQEYYLPNSQVKQEILQNLLRTTLLKIKSFPLKETKEIDTSKKSLFIRFQKLLEENISQTRNAKEYCISLDVSYRTLNDTCKTLTNKTIKGFIDDYLILNAKKLLLNKDVNISQTAYRLGFEDTTNFTKFFKKFTNQTPKSFIENSK